MQAWSDFVLNFDAVQDYVVSTPVSVQISHLTKLKRLELLDVHSGDKLPSIHNLSQLNHLTIYNLPHIDKRFPLLVLLTNAFKIRYSLK